MWDFESNECLKTFSFTCEVTCVKKVNKNKLICGFDNGTINILDSESGECLFIINEHSDTIEKILLVSNERFVTCSHDSTVKLFDLKTYECIRTFIGHENEVWCIEKLFNDKIVSCSKDKTIRIWDLNSGECFENTKRTCKWSFIYNCNFR